MALPKMVGTSVGRLTSFSLFLCTKARKNSFKISWLPVKDMTLDEKKLDGQHLLVKCSLLSEKTTIRSQVMIDCRSSRFDFIDEVFAPQHNIPLFNLKIPRSLKLIDGRTIESGVITWITRIPCNIWNHLENLPAFVTKLGHYPLVLRVTWLRHCSVRLRFDLDSVLFDSLRCQKVCIEKEGTVTVETLQP